MLIRRSPKSHTAMGPIFSKNSGPFAGDRRRQQSHTAISLRLPMFRWRRRRFVQEVAVWRSVFRRRQSLGSGGRPVVSTAIFTAFFPF
ncbi:hypothetical protein U1Q18_035754 [Sarracenia purpurea var. burkii]